MTITHLTYGLHALGLAIGAFGASTIVGAFLFGWLGVLLCSLWLDQNNFTSTISPFSAMSVCAGISM